jgi:CspA family cold shock protein
MLRIVHLLAGAAALLLSFVPSLDPGALPYLQHPDALYLSLFGLSNLLMAPIAPFGKDSHPQLQGLVSALLVIAVIVQSLVLLAPLPMIGGKPAIFLGLIVVVVAAALHLAINLPRRGTETYVPSGGSDMGNRETGTVKWFNTSKGFGFISRDTGDDIFVHFRAIRGEGHRVLIEGQRVEFSVMQRDKGLQAEDVIAALPSRY